MKSKETISCLSDRVCQHRHKHDHFLDHLKHVMKEKQDSGSYGREPGSFKAMSIESICQDCNFLVDHKQEWLNKNDRCCDHLDKGYCCSDLDHCDGLSGGHCNGHSDFEAKHRHPCHNAECDLKSLNNDCMEECQSCVE